MACIGTAKVFIPGHITGFFEIFDAAKNPLARGSRGAGLCISLGAVTEVTVESGHGIRVYINGKEAKATVSAATVENLLGKKKFMVTLNTELQLPVSQGFGMSGAGALGAALGVSRVLGLSEYDAIAAAHRTEVVNRTGLGDVAGQSVGGVEVRVRAGLPPHGIVRNIPINKDTDTVLCVVGKKILTKDILSDPQSRRKINAVGRKCMDAFLNNQTVENLFRLSNKFSYETGLSNEKIIDAIRRCEKYGMAAQSMLGNSVFATGKTDKISDIMEQIGKVWACKIDVHGPVVENLA